MARRVIVALYVLATRASTLVSEHSHLRWYGAINLASVCQLAWLSHIGFISFGWWSGA